MKINIKKFTVDYNKSDAENVGDFFLKGELIIKANFSCAFWLKIAVKLIREDFLDVKIEDPRMESVKVILINAPCSKSALMNPMEFLFQEGEGNNLNILSKKKKKPYENNL